MKVFDLVQKFEIDLTRDIEPNLKLYRERDINYLENKGECYGCGDKLNARKIPSTAWTVVQRCIACKSLNVVIVHDRMAGIGHDTLLIFRDK